MCAPAWHGHRLGIATHQGATVMKQVIERPLTPSPQPAGTTSGISRSPAHLALWQLNLLRVAYLFMGGGLAIIKWPLLFGHPTWGVAEGTKECLFIAMSFLALLGVRYPQRMLPILLFEVTWKLIWLGTVALPLWIDGRLEGAYRTEAGAVLLVVVIIAAIPWRHVFARFVTAPADPWRRRK
jgi:hypothetical protein